MVPGQGLFHGGKVPPRPVDVVERCPISGRLAEEVHHVSVHHLGSQAAPIGQHQGPVILDAQGIPRLLAGDLEKLPPYRGAGDHHPFRMLVVLTGLLIPHHHPVCHLGQPLGGEPRHRVGLMHRRGDAPAGRGVNHGVGGIPPRPHHQIGLEGVQDAGGLPLGDRKVAKGSQVVLDARGAQTAPEGADGHRLQREALLRHQPLLHAAFGPDEQNLTALHSLLKHAGQGHGRVDVPCCAAAGENNLHSVLSFFPG